MWSCHEKEVAVVAKKKGIGLMVVQVQELWRTV
jgi:hypothetical protein